MHVLATERLLLRHFHAHDLAPLIQVFGDPAVMRFGDGVQSAAWVRAWLHSAQRAYAERGFGPWALVERQGAALIGYCGLFFVDDINGQAEVEVGYRLRRVSWGQGYATEAARAVCAYALHTLHLRRVVALIDPANTASLRVAAKLGMRHENDVLLPGYTHPDHVYVLCRDRG